MLSPHSFTPAHRRTGTIEYFSVIIDGKGTLTYSTPVQYERAVLTELRHIHNSLTGRALFREFQKRSGHSLRITPYENTVLNAFAQADDLRHATLKGQPERSGSSGQILLDAAGKSTIGDGTGSNSDVSFTPRIFTNYCNQHKHAHRSGAQPDEVLFHEMVHATRQMRGILDPLPLGWMYDTEEEFFAIVLANIYASETGRPIDLRSDHHGFEHLTTDVDAKFLPKKDNADYRYRLIDKLVHQEPTMTHELRSIHCHFNPIRRYFELERTALSAHPRAFHRH
ncbi:MAG: type III secretion system effector protein [Alphaproteobacteria bacterium]|nr:type III secretion system effector protein [Alphaproteobacteria bacterium]